MEEVWKDVIGYEGSYQVSSQGRVRTLDRYVKGKFSTSVQFKKGQILKLQFTWDGYYKVTLYKKDKKPLYIGVHKLVAQSFIPNPFNKLQVNHIDCDKLNNNVINLEWCSSLENTQHAMKNNLRVVGQKSHYATITEDQAIFICEMLENNIPIYEIVSITGKTRFLISKIKNGKSWKHVSSRYSFYKERTKFND